MAEYYPRLSAPSTSDKNYISTLYGGYDECIVINKSTGSCLPNCVGYAWGRWREILLRSPSLSRNNAEVWYTYLSDGYKRGQTPKLGAVICWRSGSASSAADGRGHVMIVEQINPDGTITVSGSDYSGRYFYTKKLTGPKYKFSATSSLVFQGFIYPPVDFTDSFLPARGYFKRGDRSEKIGKIAAFMRKTFPAYTSKAALGNYFGINLEKSIKEFQRRTGLEPDGFIGPLTLEKLKKYGFDPDK